MNLIDLKGKKILWDLTPQDNFEDCVIQNEADMRAYEERERTKLGFYFYVDVWDLTALLAVMENKIGSATSSIVDLEGTTITERDLHTAIEKAGGFINLSGHYPISEELKRQLKKAMGE